MPKNSSTSRTSSLKIGFVIDDSLDRPDGVQQYVLTLGEWLGRQRHEVHYLTSTTTRRDLQNLHDLGQNVAVRFNGNRMCIPLPVPRQKIKRLMDEIGLDVVHVQTPYSPLLAGRVIMATPSDAAVVGTFHIDARSWYVSLFCRLLRIWCFFSLRRFDSMLSVSEAAQHFAWSAFRLPSTIIPNAINVKEFQAAKPLPGSHGRLPNILFLGRLVPRKGCLLLLQAVALLNSDPDVAPFSVTICGGGYLEDSLKQFTHEHSLDDVVTFIGAVLKVKMRYYASSDISVFPSTGGESFGIVLLEAMASGRAAVLAGDNAGYRSVLKDCPGDVLFNPHDAKALADRLKLLLADKAKRRHIAAWQYQHAKKFDIERVGTQIVKVYSSVLQRRRNMR